MTRLTMIRSLQRLKFEKLDAATVFALGLLVFSLALGGASRLHELRLAFVELSALPLLLWSLLALKSEHLARHRVAFALAGALVALPLIQLVPLPAQIWKALPGRQEVVLAVEVLGLPEGWLPVSLTPDRTWRSFLALLPPIAMFLGVLVLRPQGIIRLSQVLIGLTAMSVLLGAAQLASGGSALYPWATTDAGNVVGFFANRNHLATMCLVSLPFATVWGAGALRRGGPEARLILWLATVYVAMIAVALLVIRSRTGIVLFGPVVGASILAAWFAVGRGRPRPLFLAMLVGATFGIAVIGAFAVGPVLEQLDTRGAGETRFENWPVVLDAAQKHLPLGSGLGSFDAVYRSVEPLDQVDPTFFNQAHNDYLETWLEAGWMGLVLVVTFLVWFARRSWSVWRSEATTIRDMQRAATIGVATMLVHSSVDYPLRTATIAVLFALCCGLVELVNRPEPELRVPRRRRRI
jgi:O-antigen ligase